VDFFSRDVAVVRNEQVELLALNQLKSAVQAGKLNSNDLIITPLLQTVQQYRDTWTSRAEDSYLKRYF
jgi:hypothetical protein